MSGYGGPAVNRRQFLKQATLAGTASMAGCIGSPLGSEFSRKIGWILPITGPLADYGEPMSQSSELAVADFNSENESIDVVTGDTENDVQKVRSVMQGLIDDGAVAIAGPSSSDITLAAREVAEEEEVPLFSPVGTNNEITRPGTNFTYRFGGDSIQTALQLLDWFDEKNINSFAHVGADYSYPRSVSEIMKNRQGEYNTEMIYEAFIPFGNDNFLPELQEVEDSGADALFTTYTGTNSVILVDQMREQGFFDKYQILGDYGYGTASIYQALGEDLEGIFFMGTRMDSAESRALLERVEGRFGSMGVHFHTIGYDVMNITLQSVDEADSLDPAAVNAELQATDTSTLTGWDVKFNENGVNVEHQLVINEWVNRNGNIVAEHDYTTEIEYSQ